MQGNFIGANAAGTAAIVNGSNGRGIDIFGTGNTIGGTAVGAGNVISGNEGGGISIRANNNVVQGNLIGTAADGMSSLPNDGAGVFINSLFANNPNTGNNNIIGGTATGAGNRIAFNSGDGVLIVNGTGNSVRGNSIFGNNQIGIDLDQNGSTLDDDNVTPNDADDADAGANNIQNFPVITSGTSGGSNTNIQGTLNSEPSRSFTIDFYASDACDPSGFGEGQIFLGMANVATDASGTVAFSMTLPINVPVGRFITVTATDSQGNTSEFSQCRVVSFAPVSISGRLTNSSSAPLTKTQVQLSGGQSAKTITSKNGDYSFNNLPPGRNYTVTPTLRDFTFGPINRSYTNLTTNQTDQNFTATKTSFTVSGTIRSQEGNSQLPLPGASVVLQSGINQIRLTTTNNNGFYSFSNLAAGTYTVNPSKQNFGFTPPTTSVTVSANDAKADFTAQNLVSELTGRIVFTGNTGIKGMNADGSGIVTLIPSAFFESAVSPDGEKIAYVKTLSFNIGNGNIVSATEIFTTDFDGGNELRLTTNLDNDRFPAWSFDGGQIAFSRNNNIFTMNADGSNQTQTTQFQGSSAITGLGWSPDGTKLVFARGGNISVININGGNPTQLTSLGGSSFPSFSPDGTRIVFSAGNRVFVMNADGSNQTPITSDLRALQKPAWSPDSTRIVFYRQSADGLTKEIQSVESNGSNLVTIANEFGLQFSWSIAPEAATGTGSNVTTQLGAASLTFSSVSTAGTISVTPIPPNSAGTLPGGFVIGSVRLRNHNHRRFHAAGDGLFRRADTIATTQTAFDALSLMHNEGGMLVDRTTSRDFRHEPFAARSPRSARLLWPNKLVQTSLPSQG